MSTHTRLLTALAMLLTASALTCCAPGRGLSGDPVLDMNNSDLSPAVRAEAVRLAWDEALTGAAAREATRESIRALIWQRSAPSEVRVSAAESLVRGATPGEEADAQRLFALRLPTETDWPVIEKICEIAAERGWEGMTPALVRSLSRKVTEPADGDRPERHALLRIHPDRDLADIVFDVFLTPAVGEGVSRDLAERARRDAWALMERVDPDGIRRAELLSEHSGTTPDDPMLADLLAAASDLRVTPVTSSELEWLRTLRDRSDPRNAVWWREASEAIAALNDEQRRGLALRHAEPVRWASIHRSRWLSASREQLHAELEQRLRPRRVYQRTAERFGTSPAVPERLRDWRDELVWADLLTILIIDEAVREPHTVEAMFEQVERDRADTSTEYGGILAAVDAWPPESGAVPAQAGFHIVLYPPRPAQRLGPNRFVASEQMMLDSRRALAHYHYHAQRIRNRDYAGPGPGDHEYAATHRRSCIVVTSIGSNELNVDYFQPGGAVIDLGLIRR